MNTNSLVFNIFSKGGIGMFLCALALNKQAPADFIAYMAIMTTASVAGYHLGIGNSSSKNLLDLSKFEANLVLAERGGNDANILHAKRALRSSDAFKNVVANGMLGAMIGSFLMLGGIAVGVYARNDDLRRNLNNNTQYYTPRTS